MTSERILLRDTFRGDSQCHAWVVEGPRPQSGVRLHFGVTSRADKLWYSNELGTCEHMGECVIVLRAKLCVPWHIPSLSHSLARSSSFIYGDQQDAQLSGRRSSVGAVGEFVTL